MIERESVCPRVCVCVCVYYYDTVSDYVQVEHSILVENCLNDKKLGKMV